MKTNTVVGCSDLLYYHFYIYIKIYIYHQKKNKHKTHDEWLSLLVMLTVKEISG